MAIEKKAIGLFEYLENTKEVYAIKLEKAKLEYDELINSIESKREELLPCLDSFKYPIIDYPEFRENKYINGRLLDAAKGLYASKKLDMETKGKCFRLLSLAKAQKKIHDLTIDMVKYEKIVNLSYKQYAAIIKTYYTKVQELLITKGYGYVFTGHLGWICFNRVLVTDIKRKVIDFNATRLNKLRIQANGGRIYNEEEAEWCRQNNIPYDGIKPNVYKHDECWYESCLIACRLPQGAIIKMTPIKYRGKSIKKATLQELIDSCKTLADVMRLDTGMKEKLTIALQVDKTLYTKFIRNENQTKSDYGTYSRESR